MKKEEIEQKVRECIKRVAEEQYIKIEAVRMESKIVDDLGFSSLDVATLTAFLESAFHVDPFAENLSAITEIRTFADILIFMRGVSIKAPISRAQPRPSLQSMAEFKKDCLERPAGGRTK